MRQLGILSLIVCLTAASGCSICCWGKRATELGSPTDIRKAHFWCLGEDAIFEQPCGPSKEDYGLKATCWREWPADGGRCRPGSCPDGSCGPGMAPGFPVERMAPPELGRTGAARNGPGTKSVSGRYPDPAITGRWWSAIRGAEEQRQSRYRESDERRSNASSRCRVGSERRKRSSSACSCRAEGTDAAHGDAESGRRAGDVAGSRRSHRVRPPRFKSRR